MKRAAILPLVLLLVACGEPAEEPAPASPPTPTDPAAAWSGTIAYEAGVKLGGCDVGDLDPSHPGNEIAAVAADGGIHLVRHDANGWSGERIAKAPGEMIQCAIGDADPTREGNELVVVGMAEGTEDSGGRGAAFLVFRDGDAWNLEPVAEDSALIHGVLVADLLDDHPGNEVLTVGFSRKGRVLARVDGAWKRLTTLGPFPGAGKTVAMTNGVLAVANTSDGLALIDTKGEGGWEVEFAPLGTSQGRVGGYDGHFLAGCDDGTLQLVTPDGAVVIHKESAKLRGAVLADIDATVDQPQGYEAATTGYGKAVTLLYPPIAPETEWKAVTLWRDPKGLHHLAAGELLVEGKGLELVAVGYSGRVIVCARTGS